MGPEDLVAPSGAVITVSAPLGFVPINQATTLSVSVKGLNGSPVEDGTEVTLSVTLGQLDQRKLKTKAGLATTRYQAGSSVGVDTVTAISGEVRAEFPLAVGSAAVSRIQLVATPAVLPPGGGEAELVATALAPNGEGVAGVPVTFQTSAGTIKPSEAVITDGSGRARAQLTTTAPAAVRAQALDFRSDEVGLQIRAPVHLDIAAAPAQPAVGQPVTFTVVASAGGQPVAGGLRIEFGDGQNSDLGVVAGRGTATHTYQQPGGYNVTARFAELTGTETRETIRVEVSALPGPAPGPAPIPGSGDQIDPRLIRWLSPASTDVSGWRITSQITSVDISGDRICINHTKAGQWPLVSIDSNPPNIEGNPMIVVNIGGQWYGAGFDWFGQGRTCKQLSPAEYGRDQIRVPPLDASWPGPRSGDTVGLLVSTPSSDRIPVRSVNERSNIVIVRWP
jgi:hypothetical protein